MKNVPLTARYRPQLFAEVAGQETIKTILSRAAAEDRVAPAYLFSGTRGVGKTTIARIFAKALNCRKAPAAEPCNECDLCRSVTQGAAIDVVEIDGASNRGIDDVRRLKEVVGYAPMDGRYKVFIIDEAHMLSRDAFNALLKTLEEPPKGVTFIMATTEPHKFPATVVSRCQHFVFKRLTENELVAHLTSVLTAEGIEFEPSAVRLIARRGAGSVRDSMSLLGQVLVLGADSLTQETTRAVLGLAGQETFLALLDAIRSGDTLELVRLLRLFLEQGLDIGFFLRELTNNWRVMFILCQTGEAGLEAVDVPADEARVMLAMSRKFSLPHIHACWQMTLEGQRRVQSSLEPGLALELLLLNLAMLPKLMPLDALSSLARRAQVSPVDHGSASASPACSGSDSSGSGKPAAIHPDIASSGSVGPDTGQKGATGGYASGDTPGGEHRAAVKNEEPFAAATGPGSVTADLEPCHAMDSSPLPFAPEATHREKDENAAQQRASAGSFEGSPSGISLHPELTDCSTQPVPSPEKSTVSPDAADTSMEVPPGADEESDDEGDLADDSAVSGGGTILPSWADIVAKVQQAEDFPWFGGLAQSMNGAWEGGTLVLKADSDFLAAKMLESGSKAFLEKILQAMLGRVPPIRVEVSKENTVDKDTIKEMVYESPVYKDLEEILSARLIDFGKIHKQ